jgi:hypothetical protein
MFRAIDSTFLSNCTLSAHCRISGDHYISHITEEALTLYNKRHLMYKTNALSVDILTFQSLTNHKSGADECVCVCVCECVRVV